MSSPVGSSREHAQAVRGLLIAGIASMDLDYQVYETEVPAPEALTFPYLVLHPTPGAVSSTSLDDAPDRLDTIMQITCVGRDPDEALAAADTAREILLDQAPVVAGRACWRIQPEGADEPPLLMDRTALDPATGRPVMFTPIKVRVASVPG